MNRKIILKYIKKLIKYLIGITIFGLYVAFVFIHWTVPYADYWIKCIIFVVVVFVLANIAAKAHAIMNDIKKRRKSVLAMEEGKSQEIQADQIELSTNIRDQNSNIIEKTVTDKTVESIAEAIVKDIEHEISVRFDESPLKDANDQKT